MEGEVCGNCIHFTDDPEEMEAQLPGIQILGSMYGAVRGDSGFCGSNGRFMSARDWCAAFQPRPALEPGGGAGGTA